MYQGIFGVGGANLNAITTALNAQNAAITANNTNQAEKANVKVDFFSGTEGEDPVDWLKTFNRAAIINRWTTERRKLEIAGGHLKGAAADWFEDTRACNE